MSRDSIDRGAHGELANAEEDVASGRIGSEVRAVLEDGLGRSGQIGRAAEEFRNGLFQSIHDDLASIARGYRLGGREAGNGLLPIRLALVLLGAFELGGQLRVFSLVGCEE